MTPHPEPRASDPLREAVDICAKLRRLADSGLRTIGGGSSGVDANGNHTATMWGSEPIMVLANPDGPAAAALIEKLTAAQSPDAPVSGAGVTGTGNCYLCAGKCRGHSLVDPEDWEPEPGSEAALATPADRAASPPVALSREERVNLATVYAFEAGVEEGLRKAKVSPPPVASDGDVEREVCRLIEEAPSADDAEGRFHGGSYLPAARAVIAYLAALAPAQRSAGLDADTLPDIGPDPMKTDGLREGWEERLKQAYVVQQKGVPDQMALVWRVDLGMARYSLIRNRTMAELWQQARALFQPEASGEGDVERIARAIYAVQPIRVTNKPEPLTYDEAANEDRWVEPKLSLARARAAIAALAPAQRSAGLDAGIVEKARRIYRALEMSASIMRDPKRTGGWEGAERTGNAFERQAEAAKELYATLRALSQPEASGEGE